MIENVQRSFKNSPSLKVLIILVIALLLLIPRFNIESLVQERKGLQDEVISQIHDQWASEQTFSGPIFTVPYQELLNKGTKNEAIETRYVYLLPENLKIDGEIIPEERKINIYKAIVYNSELSFKGDFDLSQIEELQIDSAKIQWDKASVNFGITDPRGITSISNLNYGEEQAAIKPGLSNRQMKFPNGLHASIKGLQADQSFPFSGQISLKGSTGLYFTPFAKNTEVNIQSPWKDPGFKGAFLPTERKITDEGFTSTWKILEYNRSLQHVWDNYIETGAKWRMGVDLIDQVNIYQKVTRSVKYATLIIALTFTFFFFFEILKKLKIHPIQYTIVGFALLIFYVLLLALSEHMSFGVSFLVSAIGIVSITTYYFYFISKSKAVTTAFGFMFSSIYFFIYVILNIESHSLLIGSLGLFVLIALIMHFTRKIDWYNLNRKTIST